MTDKSEVLVAMLRDVTTMDDGRRITYYYSSAPESETPAQPGVSETSEAEQQ